MKKIRFILLSFGVVLLCIYSVNGQDKPLFKQAKLDALKKELVADIQGQQKAIQEMVDMVFSFAELGFHETETSRYLTTILAENGFEVEKGIAGIPTAWVAKWGSGKPIIAVGSDIDCIPKASQKPGVAYHDPLIEGAPGHGEGHNAGMPLNIASVLSLKKIMEREKIPGTIMLWPGVAEELVGTKAYYIREGYFKDVDACIFTHVSSNLAVGYGDSGNNGLVSVEFTFEGEAAHSASVPWRGKSALDAVELFNVSWNYHREHMEPTQRSHYVITDGGDQPNVVPAKAVVWYYFRERTYPKIKAMYDDAIRMSESVAEITGTKVSHRILGSAWPGHFNKAIAEAMYENMKKVGLPTWSEEDQLLARSIQLEVQPESHRGLSVSGLSTTLSSLGKPAQFSIGGGSDDIADIAWNVPTVVLRFPSNIPGLPGHHWANAVSMATPIAYKGVAAGAKAEAMTLLDMFVNPKILKEAWAYFNEVQTKDINYIPFISNTDNPAIWLNQKQMDEYRPKQKEYYYNPKKYTSYMEQLGVSYPTIR